MRGRMFSLLAVVATLAAAGTVQAQGSYPEKFIRLVVGFSAGGPTDLPARDWESFLAYAKANRGRINYITLGRGSAQEILALELGKLTGMEMIGVPYKLNVDMMNDLISGSVQIYVGPTLSVMGNYKAGKLGILAVRSSTRLPAVPEIPTLSEKGLPFVRFGWLGICAGAGTAQPIIALLNRHIAAIVRSP